MILALMLTRYKYSLVDTSGAPMTALPKPDMNDIHQVRCVLSVWEYISNDLIMQARPVSECFIGYQRVME